jgi:hypothetical protein
MWTEVPGWRTVTARVGSGDCSYRFVAANKLRLFLFSRKTRRGTVSPAVMRDFVPGIDYGSDRIRIRLDRMPRYVPRARDVVLT